jgi:hypothetical protein
MTNIAAGSDTTSISLSGIFYNLIKSPEILSLVSNFILYLFQPLVARGEQRLISVLAHHGTRRRYIIWPSIDTGILYRESTPTISSSMYKGRVAHISCHWSPAGSCCSGRMIAGQYFPAGVSHVLVLVATNANLEIRML